MFSYSKDGCKIHQITVPTPHMVGPVNFIIMEHANGFTLIDTGVSTEEAWKIFQESLIELDYTLNNLQQIVLTHHHSDHIGLINRILKQREVPVFAHSNAIPRLIRDREFLLFRLDFFRKLYREMGCGESGDHFIEQSKTKLVDNDHLKIKVEITPLVGSQIILGMEVIETPGHAPDHLIFYDRKRELLITGDLLLPNISSNAIVEPHMDGTRMATLVLYRQSLIKCQALQAEMVFPGHGEAFQNHSALIVHKLSRMDEKANKIKLLTKDNAKTAFELAKEMYPIEHQRQFSLVMSEIIGFLDFLELNNQIQKQLRNSVWYYTAIAT